MDKELKLLLGFASTGLIVFIAMSNLSLPMDLHTYRLTLSGEGCAYAQSIGLQVDKANGQCSALARFQPYRFGSGGVLHLDDDKKIAVTDSILLATVRSDTDLPFTAAQRAGLMWFLAWMVAAIIVCGTTFYRWGGKCKPKKE